jgi:hypothetical protein
MPIQGVLAVLVSGAREGKASPAPLSSAIGDREGCYTAGPARRRRESKGASVRRVVLGIIVSLVFLGLALRDKISRLWGQRSGPLITGGSSRRSRSIFAVWWCEHSVGPHCLPRYGG